MRFLSHALLLIGIISIACPIFAQTPATPAAQIGNGSVKATTDTPSDETSADAQDQAELRLSVGSSVERQGDSANREYSLPFFVEYGPTEDLTILVEPRYKFVRTTDGSYMSGMGDLVTAATYQFLGEGSHFPALEVEGQIKWPTAKKDLGTGEIDYSLGLIARKTFGHLDLAARGIYTFVGNPPGANLQDTFIGTLAMEWHVSPYIDVMAEISGGTGNGGSELGSADLGSLNQPAETGGEGNFSTEETIGLTEHITEHLKLVQEVTRLSDGSFGAILGWEWDFGATSTSLHRWASDPID
jgi:hypothetical protein